MLAWEWKTQDLWRLGLDVAGLHAQQQAVAEGQAQGSGSGSDAAVQARIAYLRGLMRRRGSLRAKLMLELVPLMIQAGKGREALEEIELSVNRFPYRVEPALHLYAGLLILQLSSLSLPPPSSGSSGIARPPGAPFLPPFERPRDDAILAAATHHLQGAVNAGAAQAGIQRARAAVVRRREERKAAKKRKRAADGEATGDEYDEAPPPPPPPPGDQSDEEEGDDELPQGEWAAELARSYLDMLNVPTQLGAAPRNRADRLRDRLARESQA
ncbi:hypothetical protein FA09DRAFT_11728 [Tilletiopsis washingtonensis]|uniref:Uncharacterized protein n=1 Tax=Tilletiopsis washingtonensis TaxID=58919 RepID=A0A316ZJP9_9BASI|nr:hypothetical protein FA09DRAFT_11728 [Tilletiopsis washingtonensis]PWO01359.1 hypothetical protein FA09DRAFT_11728 [Tilletiopsis washingtonensis]